jgi:hypothetical protein
MDREIQDELEKKIAENTERELPKIRALYKAGLDPDSDADFEIVLEKIEREQGKSGAAQSRSKPF